MSRVGKNPVPIPQGVECQLNSGILTAKGKLGQLTLPIVQEIKVEIRENNIHVTPISNAKFARMMWGTTQRRIKNLIIGVSNGFTRKLEINGVGYRAAVQNDKLQLDLGYSHKVDVTIPKGISIVCNTPTSITISGSDCQQVGQIASEIRGWRSPEPYKGKGIKYENEFILRKEGKKK